MIPSVAVEHRPRRWSSVVATFFLGPVAGYYAIGRTRRALAAGAGMLGYSAAAFAATAIGRPGLILTIAAIAELNHLGTCFDVFRLPRPMRKLPSWRRVLLAWVAAGLVFAVPMSILIRTFVVEAFKIPSGAMLPTLEIGDHLFAEKWRWPIRRGDVIIFEYPRDPDQHFIKRVVGLGGDTVAVQGQELQLNGVAVPARRTGSARRTIEEGFGEQSFDVWEETLDGRRYRVWHDSSPAFRRNFEPVVVPQGHVFVLGDNRDNSHDSRYWGSVPLELVRGRASYIWLSIGPDGLRGERAGLQIQ